MVSMMESGISEANFSGTMPYLRQFSLLTGITKLRAQMKSILVPSSRAIFILGSLNTSITSLSSMGEPSS